MRKDDLNKAEKERKDSRSKHILAIKEVVAQILIYLVPMFKDMSVEEVVGECLEDARDRDDPYVHLLSEEEGGPGQSRFVRDLKFLVRLPRPIDFDGAVFERALVSFESQATRPSGYVMEIRAELYACQSLLSENRALNLSTSEMMYEHVVPVWQFCFDFDPKSGKCATKIYNFKEDAYIPLNGEAVCKNDNFEESLITLYYVEIGGDFDPGEKSIYSFLYDLVINEKQGVVIKVFKDYNFGLSEEEIKMIMAGIEKVGFDKGYGEGYGKGYGEGYNKGTDHGVDITQKKNFDNLVKYLMANENLSRSEAEENALKALSLEKVPV